jgi:glutathione S-transferase
MRPWLVLSHAGARFETHTVGLDDVRRQGASNDDSAGLAQFDRSALSNRRALGSVTGLFPVLRVDGVPIHESLAICEYVAEAFPEANLWPADRIERARARAISCEMASGFADVRGEMSSHLFARVPDFSPSPATELEIARVFEIWHEYLNASGGPFLFGRLTVADAMYFPALRRFRTYGIEVPATLVDYANQLEALPASRRLIELARSEPRISVYDDYIRSLGGNPDAALIDTGSG